MRVYNALNVLDFLGQCSERRAEHLAVEAIAKLRAEVGERALGELLERFEVAADEPIVVELFPSAELFSSRVTGLPGLDVNAACLGSVVALLVPGAVERPFNWYDALIHELGHTLCHLLGRGKLPQWLEEGLSVWVEGVARGRSWNLVLVYAHRANELLPLSDLDRGFLADPASPERSLAYAQSQLAVEFLLERAGWEKLVALLKEAGRRDTWEQALGATFEMTAKELEEDYAKFLDGCCGELSARMALAESLGAALAEGGALSGASTEALRRLLREEPGVFDAGRLWEWAGDTSDPALREELLWAIVRLDRADVGSAVWLADLLSQSGRTEEAEDILHVALGAGLEVPPVHTALARVALARQAKDAAVREAELAWQLLSDGSASVELAERGWAWEELSQVLADLGEEERSRQAATRARALSGSGTGAPGEAP